jgi:hypothetical protein
VLALQTAVPSAQTITASAPDLTAAFLIKFVNFVEWPPEVLAPDAPLTLCVGDQAVANAAQAVPRHQGGRTLAVVSIGPGTVPPECALLYVSGLDSRRTAALVTSLQGRSVLTISDSEDFAKSGGIIQLYLDNGSMRFLINPAAAERSRLHLSSLLLKVAGLVKE